MMHVIDDEKDVEFLHWLKDRLYSEQRMTGDNMRDAANRLYLILNNLVKVDESDLPTPTTNNS